ncbi:MAG: glycosyltransferase family 4 protein [Chloroflexota bacterium]|nr:MAG: glycosyltransferase family 4 protein [Chloroflexota bacterium]
MVNTIKVPRQETFSETKKIFENIHSRELSSEPERKIRVLVVITQLAMGGATNVALDLASYFNQHPDFDVQLITGPASEDRNDVTHLAFEYGIKTRVLPSLINEINPIANLRAITDIRKIILEENFDIVHTHTKVAGVVGRLAARSTGSCVIIHHVHGWGSPEGMSMATRMLHVSLEWLCGQFSDRIIVVSKPDINKGRDYHIGGEDKLMLIYNGIDLEKFRQPVDEMMMRSKLGLETDSKLVGMIGRLEDQKNPLDFIRAAAHVSERYSRVQFLMVGGGPLQLECEQLIDECDLTGKFFLLGFRDDVDKILSILTMTAMSSLWEGLPIAFLESMSAGKPIVANDVDGASDVVKDGETGFLVPPHQPSEMAERILTLLNDEELCEKMGELARQRSSFYSKQRMLENVETLYKDLYSTSQVLI